MNFTLEDYCKQVMIDIYETIDSGFLTENFCYFSRQNHGFEKIRENFYNYSRLALNDVVLKYDSLDSSQKKLNYVQNIMGDINSFNKKLNKLYKNWCFESIYLCIDDLEETLAISEYLIERNVERSLQKI